MCCKIDTREKEHGKEHREGGQRVLVTSEEDEPMDSYF